MNACRSITILILQSIFLVFIQNSEACPRYPKSVPVDVGLPSVMQGYRIGVYATGLCRPRLMQLTKDGDIILTTFRRGTIELVLADNDSDGKSDGIVTLATDLERPHGLVLEGEDLIVAERRTISIYKYSKKRLAKRKVILDKIPGKGRHTSRTVRRGPDGYFYVSIGSSCDVCIEEHPWHASIIRFKVRAKPAIYATGLRNVVGFDWRPNTSELFAVNAGPDRIGDKHPREELNLIKQGKHYGWPYVFGPKESSITSHLDMPITNKFEYPVHTFASHSTPLSIRFLRFQSELVGKTTAALVARHGSRDRRRGAGYDVLLVRWDQKGKISHEPFVWGFLNEGRVLGRPVDVIESSNGVIFISDDFSGTIYRVEKE